VSTQSDRPAALKASVVWWDDQIDMVELRVIAAGFGFGGQSTAYFNPLEIEAFARALATYPLRDEDRRTLRGSVGNDQRVSVAASQVDNVGHIAIDVELAAVSYGPLPHALGGANENEVRVRLFTTYEHLARFSRELLLVLQHKAEEAELLADA